MNEMHEFIFKQGFLILLIVFWFVWFMMLERRGFATRTQNLHYRIFTNIEISECENHCQGLCHCPGHLCILAVWSTYEVTMNEENLKFKGVAEDCQYDSMEGYVDSEGKSCFVEMNIWDNVWDRSIRGWLFSGIVAMLAIVKVPQPKVAGLWEEE